MENLRDILLRNGFSFKKQFGQNFISDSNLLKSIVSLAGIDKDTTVLEIGCGAGTLTRELAAAAKKVVSFEIDQKLQPVLAETLSGIENAEVIFRDFMKTNLSELEKNWDIIPSSLISPITSPRRSSCDSWKNRFRLTPW